VEVVGWPIIKLRWANFKSTVMAKCGCWCQYLFQYSTLFRKKINQCCRRSSGLGSELCGRRLLAPSPSLFSARAAGRKKGGKEKGTTGLSMAIQQQQQEQPRHFADAAVGWGRKQNWGVAPMIGTGIGGGKQNAKHTQRCSKCAGKADRFWRVWVGGLGVGCLLGSRQLDSSAAGRQPETAEYGICPTCKDVNSQRWWEVGWEEATD